MLRVLVPLANRVCHFPCFAQAESHATLAIANNDERAEAEAAATLDDLGRTIDENHLLDEVALLLLEKLAVTIAPAGTTSATTASAVTAASATKTTAATPPWCPWPPCCAGPVC